MQRCSVSKPNSLSHQVLRFPLPERSQLMSRHNAFLCSCQPWDMTLLREVADNQSPPISVPWRWGQWIHPWIMKETWWQLEAAMLRCVGTARVRQPWTLLFRLTPWLDGRKAWWVIWLPLTATSQPRSLFPNSHFNAETYHSHHRLIP